MPSEKLNLKLNLAIAAVKIGDKVTGLRLLSEVIKGEPANEMAWLWLSACLANEDQKKYCLTRVLLINPGNQTAQKALAQLEPPPQPSIAEITGDVPQSGAAQGKVLAGKLVVRQWERTELVETFKDFSSLAELYSLVVKMPDPHLLEHIIIQGQDERGQPRELTLFFQSLTASSEA